MKHEWEADSSCCIWVGRVSSSLPSSRRLCSHPGSHIWCCSRHAVVGPAPEPWRRGGAPRQGCAGDTEVSAPTERAAHGHEASSRPDGRNANSSQCHHLVSLPQPSTPKGRATCSSVKNKNNRQCSDAPRVSVHIRRPGTTGPLPSMEASVAKVNCSARNDHSSCVFAWGGPSDGTTGHQSDPF